LGTAAATGTLAARLREYPGKWKARKLIHRWVTDELLIELAKLNPLELAAQIIFPNPKPVRKSPSHPATEAEFEITNSLQSQPVISDGSAAKQQTEDWRTVDSAELCCRSLDSVGKSF
jgi:hypothetical protein